MFDDSVSSEHVDAIATAVGLMQGVSSTRLIADPDDFEFAREQINAEWRQRIVGLLDDEGV
jgi:hypothetical protein